MICILVVLVALLFPALLNVRSAAKGALCMQNVRTVLLASLNYSLDHGGGFPRLGFDETGEQEGLSLCVVLHPTYLKQKSIRCPLAPAAPSAQSATVWV